MKWLCAKISRSSKYLLAITGAHTPVSNCGKGYHSKGEGFGEILLNPQSNFRSNYFQTSLLQSVLLPKNRNLPHSHLQLDTVDLLPNKWITDPN